MRVAWFIKTNLRMSQMNSLAKKKTTIVLFLLPALLIYIALEVVPVIQSFYFSFFEWPGMQGVALKFVGFRNFIDLFENESFLQSIKNILWFVVLSLLTQIPIGFLFAILLGKLCKGYKFFKATYFLPLVLPVTATSLLWRFILMPNEMGVLNYFLISLGLDSLQRGWLIEPGIAMTSVILVTAWAGTAYYMTIGFAAVTSIPDEIIESSVIDGAGELRRVFYITIPMIWESVKISVIMVITGILKIFDIVFIMTEGGPNGLTHVPATLMYYEAYKYNHYGLGSAISTVIFLLCIIITIMSLRIMTRKDPV